MVMTGMLFATAVTAAILLIGEWLWRKKITKGEIARKFVHISVATFAAFWPFFMSRFQIVCLGLIFVAVLVVIKQFRIFRSLHSIKRATYGDIWYALGICLVALLFKDNAIYAIAVLHMALADGFAAVVGVGLARKARIFYFRGCRKSVAGTATFFIISFLLNMGYWLIAAHQPVTYGSIFVLYSLLAACLLAATEITAPKGSDNVIVPFLSGTILWLPTVIAVSSLHL
jgi:dolichol kinase